MKITKEHVGKRVINVFTGQVLKIKYCGHKYFIYDTLDDGVEDWQFCDGDWEILPDPKPQGAPALFRINRNPKWATSSFLYTSREEAERELSLPKCDIIWPAIPDPKTGMYTLPED